MHKFLPFLLIAVWIQTVPAAAEALDQPLRAVIDVRSTHSDGKHGMRELAIMAQKRGIQVLAYTEHDRTGIRFGLEPAPQILGYTYERPSLYTTGLDAFFDGLKQVRSTIPKMTLFAGTESTPSYYWTGMPISGLSWDEITTKALKGLTLHEADRHFITLGIETPEQVEALPSYDLRNVRQHPWFSLAVWASLALLSVLLLLVFRRKRIPLLILLGSCAAFSFAWLDKAEIDPDVDFIESAREQGLFVVWTHPGTLSGVRSGSMDVQLSTLPYSLRAFQDPTADAFAAKYGDTDSNTVPGGLWDRYLMGYMKGEHERPIWAVAAGDFHFEGMANESLGNYPMDVWAGGRSPEVVLEAMKKGHMVAWHMPGDRNIGAKKLHLQDMTGTRLIPGDEKKVVSQVILHMELVDLTPSQTSAAPFSLKAEVVVDGKVVVRSQVSLQTPMQEILQLAPGPHVIRVRSGQMEANPFLVHVFSY